MGKSCFGKRSPEQHTVSQTGRFKCLGLFYYGVITVYIVHQETDFPL